MSDKKVIVYGASGYTGRLVCEYLREFGVPFIAAGRDKARIAEALSTVPGIDTVDHDIVEVAHDVGPLSELFDGARVVCNMVGPFAQHGGEVVEACLAAGAHYLDTTGEQDGSSPPARPTASGWRSRACSWCSASPRCTPPGRSPPSCAWRSPGWTRWTSLVFWKGMPTIASTRTILVNAALAKAYYLEQNAYAEWPADGGLYHRDRARAARDRARRCRGAARLTPCGSGRTRGWRTSRSLGGVFNRALMLGVPQIVAARPRPDRGAVRAGQGRRHCPSRRPRS